MMKKKPIRLLIPALAAFTLPALAAQPAPPPACVDSEGYVCGQQGPEDLVAMGNDWAVSSAYAGTGGVTLIRIRDRKSMTVYPSSTAKEQLDTKTYPKCPGAPRGAFTTHGVYVVPGAGPVYKLFVVGSWRTRIHRGLPGRYAWRGAGSDLDRLRDRA